MEKNNHMSTKLPTSSCIVIFLSILILSRTCINNTPYFCFQCNLFDFGCCINQEQNYAYIAYSNTVHFNAKLIMMGKISVYHCLRNNSKTFWLVIRTVAVSVALCSCAAASLFFFSPFLPPFALFFLFSVIFLYARVVAWKLNCSETVCLIL